MAGFLFIFYWHKLTISGAAGITSEVSALTIYLVGALVYQGHFWVATALSVASALLLELKGALRGLHQADRSARDSYLHEISTPHCCHFANLAESGVWSLSDQPLQDLARGRCGKHGVIRELRAAKADQGTGGSTAHGNPNVAQ
jgi:hypothetical protein